jgi:hypothetical protein
MAVGAVAEVSEMYDYFIYKLEGMNNICIYVVENRAAWRTCRIKSRK